MSKEREKKRKRRGKTKVVEVVEVVEEVEAVEEVEIRSPEEGSSIKGGEIIDRSNCSGREIVKYLPKEISYTIPREIKQVGND